MRIILMRHGDCNGLKEGIINGWLDLDLTKKGKSEANDAAKNIQKLLGKVIIDKAYSSYLSRTFDTARILCEALKYKGTIKQDIRLNERHYGMFQGMKKSDAVAFKEYNTLSSNFKRLDNRLVEENDIRHNALLNEYSMKLKKPIKKIEHMIPRSESILDVEGRLLDFIKEEVLNIKNKDKTILIVTHANPAKLITKYMNKLSYKQTSLLRFATCGMKIFDVNINSDNSFEILTEYNINKEWNSIQ